MALVCVARSDDHALVLSHFTETSRDAKHGPSTSVGHMFMAIVQEGERRGLLCRGIDVAMNQTLDLTSAAGMLPLWFEQTCVSLAVPSLVSALLL